MQRVALCVIVCGVVAACPGGEAALKVGRKDIVLPKAVTPENVNRRLMLPIDPAALSPETPFAFRVAPGHHAAYRVDMTSIALEGR
jgi:hypothetical protein